MNTPRRLLVRGVNWLGDAILSMPALARLRAALPKTHITLLTAAKLADLWDHHDAIDETLSFNRQQGIGQVSRALRAGRFDAALILPGSFRSAMEAWLAGIPIRVGYGRPLLLTHRVQPRLEHVSMRKRTITEIRKLVNTRPEKGRDTYPPSGHHLHQYLRLVGFFGASEQPVSPVIQVTDAEVAAFRSKFGVKPSRALVGLNPGAEYGPAKRWPLELIIETAVKLGTPSLIFGGPGDLSLATAIQARIPGAISLAGRTSLRELAVGLSICDVVLTNDTGPMHLAAAVGTTVVVPFGSTSPELTGPGNPAESPHRLIVGDAPCAPCFRRVCPIDFRCMRSITSETVVRALAEVLRSA